MFACFFGVGIAILIRNSRWGIGIQHDSIFYLTAAKNLAVGKGLSWFGDGGELKPLAHFPPLYPMILSAFFALGMEAGEAARWLAAILFGANVTLIGTLAYYFSSRLWAGFLASLLASASSVLLGIHVIALSEPISLLLTLLFFALLSNYIAAPKKTLFIAYTLLAALSCLSRYIGIVVLGTGFVCLLFMSNRNLRCKLRDAASFSLLAIIPLCLWLFRNVLITGTATNRVLRFHPPQKLIIAKFTQVAVGWFNPYDLAFRSDIAIMLALLLLLGYRMSRLWIDRKSHQSRSFYFAFSLVLYSAFYLGFLVFSITFYDASTPIDNRILSPIYACLLILIVLIVGISPKGKGTLPWNIMLFLFLAALGWVQIRSSTEILKSLKEEGIGFSSQSWKESETILWVDSLESEATLYTNERLALTFLTGRHAYSVPEKVDPVKETLRSDFGNMLELMQVRLKEPKSYLILFNPDNLPWGLPTLDEITLALAAIEHFDDATIYINPINMEGP